MARETRESCEKRSSLLIRLFATFAYFAGLFSAVAEEPFFKKGDVIALVGGEDMVAMSEYGYLELLLTRALPEHRLKFRNLAWEGDTVFEQRRDLNFPPLEAQLDQVGATVIICQFGQMESLAGKPGIPKFYAAYAKLIERLSGGGKRRLLLLAPFECVQSVPLTEEDSKLVGEHKKNIGSSGYAIAEYCEAIRWLENDNGLSPIPGLSDEKPKNATDLPRIRFLDHRLLIADDILFQRDGIHLTATGHLALADEIGADFGVGRDLRGGIKPNHQSMLNSITTKNRLWFDYWRVQNWAFLAGDRTEQPSSRDHLDRTQRWFPAEREQFLPLIEKKEQEIWSLAAKLSEQK